MFKPNPEQKRLLRQASIARQEFWRWIKLYRFIDKEAQMGSFTHLVGPLGHLDPEKAARDPLGKKLLRLRELFSMRAQLAGDKWESAAESAKNAGVPTEIIEKIFRGTGILKSTNPTMEKLLSHLKELTEQPELLRREAISKLREAIRKADAFASQKEMDSLWDSLVALESRPVEYKPAPHVEEYLKLRRRARQRRRRV